MFSFKNQKRFWSKVNCTNNLDECWNWIGLKDKDGYGKIKICGKTIRSHRYVYSLYYKYYINKNWSKEKIAQRLGVSIKSLYRYIKKYEKV